MRMGSYRVGQAVRDTTKLLENADFGGYRILLALADRAFDDGTVGVTGDYQKCVGQKRIAKDARVHYRTVQNWIPKLVERGELIIKAEGGAGQGRWTVYQLPHVEKHQYEQRMPYENETDDALMEQENGVMAQGYSANAENAPVDNPVDNLKIMAQQISELTQAIQLLTQQNALMAQENDVMAQANGTNGTTSSHTGVRTKEPTKPIRNNKPLPTTQNEFQDYKNSGGGGGGGDREQIINALIDFKVWRKTAIEIASMPHCTLDYVQSHIAQAKFDKLNPQTLSWRLQNQLEVSMSPDRALRQDIRERYEEVVSR